MATTTTKSKAKRPLKVKLLNASGQVIDGIIPSGQLSTEDPGLAIASELGDRPGKQVSGYPA